MHYIFILGRAAGEAPFVGLKECSGLEFLAFETSSVARLRALYASVALKGERHCSFDYRLYNLSFIRLKMPQIAPFAALVGPSFLSSRSQRDGRGNYSASASSISAAPITGTAEAAARILFSISSSISSCSSRNCRAFSHPCPKRTSP